MKEARATSATSSCARGGSLFVANSCKGVSGVQKIPWAYGGAEGSGLPEPLLAAISSIASSVSI